MRYSTPEEENILYLLYSIVQRSSISCSLWWIGTFPAVHEIDGLPLTVSVACAAASIHGIMILFFILLLAPSLIHIKFREIISFRSACLTRYQRIECIGRSQCNRVTYSEKAGMRGRTDPDLTLPGALSIFWYRLICLIPSYQCRTRLNRMSNQRFAGGVTVTPGLASTVWVTQLEYIAASSCNMLRIRKDK